jgi:DNA (cytosine-5)-methyltransferase 1
MRQHKLDIHKELIVDLFAGGGGFSEGVLMASGRHPDIAINHNDDALSMHRANHPDTRHFVADVFEVCPKGATQGRPVGHLHLSPDCTHHSQARGGQPRNEKIRGLSWVGVRWAGQVRPRVITLENVHQVELWGPLIAKRDALTGRVMKLDGSIAEKGERVPREFQYLIPDPKRKGITWKAFTSQLKKNGYEVETGRLVASDFGAGTKRTRLFMIARCDGVPIEFPQPTHFKNPSKGQKKWSAAHEHINFDLPAKSIFEREKPLKPTTMKRIAKGIKRFVLDTANPFIVPITNSSNSNVQSIHDPLNTITTSKGGEFALATPVLVRNDNTSSNSQCNFTTEEPIPTITGNGGIAMVAPVLTKMRFNSEGASLTEPLPTITAGGKSKRPAGHPHAMALTSAVLVQAGHGEGKPGGVKRWGQGVTDVRDPLGTVTASGDQSLASAVLIQRGHKDADNSNTNRASSVEDSFGTLTGSREQSVAIATMVQMGYGEAAGQEPRALDINNPIGTITAGGNKFGLVTAHVCTLRNNQDAESADAPLSTICTSGAHHALVECNLSDDEEKALRVANFLISYYGTENMSGLDDPLPTITTKDRLALVTVIYQGTPYLIVDIKLRMLSPPELFSAQGFGKHYIIDRGHDGRKFSGSKQVRMCGNSVSPYPAAALYAACHKNTEMRLVA